MQGPHKIKKTFLLFLLDFATNMSMTIAASPSYTVSTLYPNNDSEDCDIPTSCLSRIASTKFKHV